MKHLKLLISVIFIFFYHLTFYAQWNEVGSIGFSDGIARYTKLELHNNIPYVVYKDGAYEQKATVKKFNGTIWETVGIEGFSNVIASSIDLAFYNNEPYIAYMDNDNSGMPSIMKFNGTNWETVTAPTTETVQYISLVEDGGYLYISYKDFSNSFRATVKRYDGTNWIKLGDNDASTGDVFWLDLFIHNNTPYLAYKDADNAYGSTVVKYNGTSWETVGLKGFSPGEVAYTELAFYQNELHIAFSDYTISRKVSVMKFNGVNWAPVPSANLTEDLSSDINLQPYDNGNYLLIFYVAENGSYGIVKKYDGAIWETVDGDFPSGYMSHTDLDIDNNFIYATFDGSPGGKTSVVKNSNTFTSAPSCTNLSTPLNGATNVSISSNIDWTAITNATGYYISIGTTSGGTEIANREDVGNVTTYNPSTDFAENQDIYVTVIPYNSIGEATACSEESFLTETIVLAPSCTNLSTPLNGATNVSISSNIDWTAITNATGYYISIGTTSGGTEIANREDVGNVTTYNPSTDFAENQDIYVTVIPYNSIGEATACSEESFLTETIILAPSCTNLSTPLNGATNVSISSNIDWTAITNATGYYISIGTTSGGTEIANREDVGNVTTYNPSTDFAENQDIYVTVIPYNSIGEATTCSEESFLTETIVLAPSCTNLSTPLNGATNVSISSNIDWTAITNATGYYISIGTTSGGTEIANREDVGNVTTYNPSTDFAENQDIYVTVIPYNSIGEATTCSEEIFLTENGMYVIPDYLDPNIEVNQLVTPNGDADNDFLFIRGLSKVSSSTLQIFNRWGILVFEAENYNNQNNVFTGQSRGRSTFATDSYLPSGIYYYIFNYTTVSGNTGVDSEYLYISK